MTYTKQLACLLCLLAGFFLKGCEGGETAVIQPNQPLTIALNQPAEWPQTGLSLTFTDVLEDSRCPSSVTCVEAGAARITVAVSQPGLAPASLELNTNPPLQQDVATYGNFQIQLLKLEPYPEEIRQHIPARNYQATFVVTERP
ncbi:MAG: hypothetical protein R3D55_04400 [Chloroflexota bacterium]